MESSAFHGDCRPTAARACQHNCYAPRQDAVAWLRVSVFFAHSTQRSALLAASHNMCRTHICTHRVLASLRLGPRLSIIDVASHTDTHCIDVRTSVPSGRWHELARHRLPSCDSQTGSIAQVTCTPEPPTALARAAAMQVCSEVAVKLGHANFCCCS